MAIISVPCFSSFINHQIKQQEKIESCLWQLEALIAVAIMTDDFYELSEKVLGNYFSIASDLLEQLKKVNQANLKELFQAKVE